MEQEAERERQQTHSHEPGALHYLHPTAINGATPTCAGQEGGKARRGRSGRVCGHTRALLYTASLLDLKHTYKGQARGERCCGHRGTVTEALKFGNSSSSLDWEQSYLEH